MSEPRAFECIPLKRTALYLVGKPEAALRFRRQERVDKITVFVDGDVAGDPVPRKSTTALVAQIGNHTVKSGSTLQSLAALSGGEAEIYGVVKGCQAGLSLGSTNMDLGFPMKVELHCDSSTVISLTDQLGTGPRKKHTDSRFFGSQESVQDGDLTIKTGPTAKICADVGTKPVSAEVPQQHCKVAGLIFY